MQKAIRHVLAVLSRVLFIGLSCQIILGVLWTCCNFGKFQQFGDSFFYKEVSESLLFDEYTGALYPVIVMLTRGLEEMLPIPYTYAIHMLQMAVAGYVGWRFLRMLGVEKCFFAIWGSLALFTFPMLLQCHLAILPHSLTFSVFLLEVGFVIEAMKQKRLLCSKQLCKIGICWTVSTLLMPEYLYFGAVPVLLNFLFCRKKHLIVDGEHSLDKAKSFGRQFFYNVFLVFLFAVAILGIEGLVQQKGAYGRPEQAIEASFFRRVAWTSLNDYYEQWPEEMKQICSRELVRETAGYADHMERLLQPQLEEAVGAPKAQEWYWQVGKMVLENNSSKILHEVAWDVVSLTLPPVATQMLLKGRGYDSYVGRNYEIMKAEAPVLTKHYVNYSCWWFVVGIVLAFIIEVGLLLLKKRSRIYTVVICVVTSVSQIMWYALMGAGVWDYKNALFVGAVWLVWMISAMERSWQVSTDIA